MHYPYSLHINRLRLSVSLGVTAGERKSPQAVEVDVSLYFADAPKGFEADDAPYLCYDLLCQKIIALVEQQEFLLIEYLTASIYEVVRNEITHKGGTDSDTKVTIMLHKCSPPVSYTLGSSGFSFSDLGADDTILPQLSGG